MRTTEINSYERKSNLKITTILASTLLCAVASTSARAADTKKPNILIIWGDDVGM